MCSQDVWDTMYLQCFEARSNIAFVLTTYGVGQSLENRYTGTSAWINTVAVNQANLKPG